MFQRKIAEKLDNFKGEFHKRKTELTGQLNKLSTDITAANAQLVNAMKAGFENNQKQIMEANKKLAILEDEFAQVNKDLESTLVKLHQQDKTLLNLTWLVVRSKRLAKARKTSRPLLLKTSSGSKKRRRSAQWRVNLDAWLLAQLNL